ncbi:MAG: hypothetical protein KF833_08330 [Verrucomicrobiae bacterium]|nr:hypothetical protein [Verrucomicrobiae bacterium]
MTTPFSRRVIWGIFALLFILHHDFWWWDDRSLVLGVVPIGLAYHGMFSVAAAMLWAAATRFAWPGEIEAWAEHPVTGDEGGVR